MVEVAAGEDPVIRQRGGDFPASIDSVGEESVVSGLAALAAAKVAGGKDHDHKREQNRRNPVKRAAAHPEEQKSGEQETEQRRRRKQPEAELITVKTDFNLFLHLGGGKADRQNKKEGDESDITPARGKGKPHFRSIALRQSGGGGDAEHQHRHIKPARVVGLAEQNKDRIQDRDQ